MLEMKKGQEQKKNENKGKWETRGPGKENSQYFIK